MRQPHISPPSVSDLPPLDTASNTQTTWTMHLKTITPLFGGGAVAREVDPVVPIRAAAIRGHLRFWWRATAGAAYSDAVALFKAEEAIWGSVKKPGAVALRVVVDNPGKERRFSLSASQRDGPLEGYFLFPFAMEEQKPGERPSKFALGREKVEFTLTLTMPATVSDQIRRALQVWILFGGVGARTRRGLGALQAMGETIHLWSPPADFLGLKSYLTVLARDVVPPPGMPKFSRLKQGAIFLGDVEPNPLIAWQELGHFWSRFRKGHYTQKHSTYQPTRDGDWRDHSVLREMNQRNSEVALAKPFLGLPIEYQYFPARNGHSEAFEGNIRPHLPDQKSDRMASPVILKPVAFADGSIRPMVAVLRTPLPRAVRVKSKNGHELELKLNAPTDQTESVLTALKARHPLEAVQEAASKFGFPTRIDL